MICKLCDKEKDILESHIYSKFLYKNMVDVATDKKIILFDRKNFIPGKYKLVPPTFERLLCKDCEGKLSKEYETPISKLFYGGSKKIRTNTTFYKLDDGNIHCENELIGVESKTVKNFLLSLIWRSSVASRVPFNKFKINKNDEDKIKNIVYNNIETDDYSIYVYNIAKYETNYKILNPDLNNIKLKDVIVEPFILDDKCFLIFNGLMFLIDFNGNNTDTYIKDNKLNYVEIIKYNEPFIIMLNTIFSSLLH